MVLRLPTLVATKTSYDFDWPMGQLSQGHTSVDMLPNADPTAPSSVEHIPSKVEGLTETLHELLL